MPPPSPPPLRSSDARLAVVATLLVLLVLPVVGAATDPCSALAYNTLSQDCSDVCTVANASCVVYASLDASPCQLADMSPHSVCLQPETNASCVYQCFTPFSDSSFYKFYVYFNITRTAVDPPGANWTATASKYGTGTLVSTPANASDTDVPYETNNFVRRIGVLNAPDVAQVVISGGRDENTATKGDVADLEIDSQFLSKILAPQLIALMNVNLGQRLPDLPSLLPSTVTSLDMTNTNLTQVPPSLGKSTQLTQISLLRNNIAEVPASLSLPALKVLYLGENLLTTFDLNFTALTLLDLSTNNLAQFPSVIFGFPNLTTLQLLDNPEMATVVFSTSQYTKLTTLEDFSIDDGVMDNSSCTADQVKTLHKQTVCVVTDAELAAYTGHARSATTAPSSGTDNSNSNTTTDSGGGMSTTVMVVIILVVAVIVLGGGAAGYAYYGKRKHPHADPTNGSEYAKSTTTGPSGSGSGPVKKARHAALLLSEGSVFSSGQSLWDDDEMTSHQLELEGIQDLKVIGSGGFAIVWLVKYIPRNQLMASKRLIKDQVTRQKTMDFVMEIKLNMQLDHPNIVKLEGVAWTIETDLQALLEYLPNGDLRSYLEASESSPLPWTAQKLQFAIDIIDALVYVHSFQPPLAHRDLKSRNVLLSKGMKAKLCDFGVSRFVSDNGTMTTGVGTGKWLAPEVIAGSTSYDASCDIYAFGVMMAELDTHKLPYDDVTGPQGNKLPEVAILQMVASGQVQPTLRESCPDVVRQIAQQCMSFEPSSRPTAVEVAFALRTAMRELFSPKEVQTQAMSLLE